MDAVPNRRWYRLHWLTWIAVLIQLSAIAYCEFVRQPGGLALDGAGPAWEEAEYSFFGWPAIYLEQIERRSMFMVGTSSVGFARRGSDFTWYSRSMALDCVLSSVLLVSVACVVERLVRKRKRWQFSLLGLALLIVVIGAMMTLIKQRLLIGGAMREFRMQPNIVFDEFAPRDADRLPGFIVLLTVGFTMTLLVSATYRVVSWLLGRMIGTSAADSRTK